MLKKRHKEAYIRFGKVKSDRAFEEYIWKKNRKELKQGVSRTRRCHEMLDYRESQGF